MDIIQSTQEYERWLSKQLTIVPADLQQKHLNMAADPFRFLRATYYRWTQRFPVVCAPLLEAREVLSVGDLHIENFGTWRDVFARLVWGVNDFDEAFPLPFTNDLVRLATSVRLAMRAGQIEITAAEACEAIFSGYVRGLTKGAQPFILDHKHGKLRRMAFGELREPPIFWAKMKALPAVKGPVPASAEKALTSALPEDAQFVLKTRRAGEGSLGRQRFVALAQWRGGLLAREAKAIAPAASVWASGIAAKPKVFYNDILQTAVRCEDPCLHVTDKWILRRLSPDCCRIELGQLEGVDDTFVLLKAMGRETANIHAPNAQAASAILENLDSLAKNWLLKASAAMTEDVLADWRVWRNKFNAH